VISSDKGFSLIEVIIVMVIISALVAIAAPSMISWRQQADYRNVSQRIFQVLKKSRNGAISKNREYRVEFDLDNSDNTFLFKIREGDRASNSSASGWEDISVWDDSSIPVSVALRGGTDCDEVVDIVFGFNPNGSSSANYICIMDAKDLTRKYKVGIENSITGRVTIER